MNDESQPSSPKRSAFEIVALVSSAGGLQALSTVLAPLPGAFPAPIVVVQHLEPHHRSLMTEILSRRTPLKVHDAAEGDRILPGNVYIAPPDRHLLVNRGGTLSLSESERVRFLRPSADLLLESVAASYGPLAIAVVLTGTGSDGALGIRAIKETGGTVIAQDQATAQFFGMPGAAARTGKVDLVLALTEIPVALLALVRGTPY